MSLLTLLFVIIVAGLTVNVYAPLKSSERLMGLTFGLGWLTGELAGHAAIAIVLITSIIAAGEGFEGFIGWVGLLVDAHGMRGTRALSLARLIHRPFGRK